ncbi:MAG: hypothetical protein PHI27_12550 [Eubacteriales bacterium]|nr:hypothetical protein [Eubacteriales bacterium]MDD3883052.1 hypothetical protein [Eubacteriales bacterium]MDD4513603.1 hypothetical protein [Eubacteriales bacterium]
MLMLRIVVPRADEKGVLASLIRAGFSGVTSLAAHEDREGMRSLLIAVKSEDAEDARSAAMGASPACNISEKAIEQSYSIRTGGEFIPERSAAV